MSLQRNLQWKCLKGFYRNNPYRESTDRNKEVSLKEFMKGNLLEEAVDRICEKEPSERIYRENMQSEYAERFSVENILRESTKRIFIRNLHKKSLGMIFREYLWKLMKLQMKSTKLI